MRTSKLTRGKLIPAFAIAILADLLQFPITAATATGWLAIPGETADMVIDFVTMLALSALLGFHWVLLPTFLVELVPGVDLIPTWTGSVAFIIWQRKQAASASAPTAAANPPVIIDVEEVPTKPAEPAPQGKSIPHRGNSN